MNLVTGSQSEGEGEAESESESESEGEDKELTVDFAPKTHKDKVAHRRFGFQNA